MTEEEIVDSFAVNEEISLFGKYRVDEISEHIRAHQNGVNILVNNGFVDVEYQNIEGLPTYHNRFITFNERWRNLKRFGSYHALVSWEDDMERKKEEKINLENELLQSQLKFQEINNKYIELQEVLIDSQLITNTNTRKTNERVKTILIVTALIYLGQLFVSMYGLVSSNAGTPKQVLLMQQDSLIKTMGIRIYQKENQESHYRNEIDSLKAALDSSHRTP